MEDASAAGSGRAVQLLEQHGYLDCAPAKLFERCAYYSTALSALRVLASPYEAGCKDDLVLAEASKLGLVLTGKAVADLGMSGRTCWVAEARRQTRGVLDSAEFGEVPPPLAGRSLAALSARSWQSVRARALASARA